MISTRASTIQTEDDGVSGRHAPSGAVDIVACHAAGLLSRYWIGARGSVVALPDQCVAILAYGMPVRATKLLQQMSTVMLSDYRREALRVAASDAQQCWKPFAACFCTTRDARALRRR